MGLERNKHIQECYDEEQRNPPVPRKYGDIPVSYNAITTEWLTATLGREHPEAKVKSFKLGPEDDGTSNRRRIYLEWAGEDTGSLPKSVFCKAAHNNLNRIMLANGGTYSEVTFFNRVRPNIDIEAPTAYFAAYDPESWRSMIMLRDMGPSTTFCTHKTALSKGEHAEQFQILAKLHGQFYQTKEDFFSALLGTRERFVNNVKSLDIEVVCGNGFRAAQDVIPPRLFARQAEIWPLTIKSVDRNDLLPQTVVHSDVHLGNWYITSEGHMGLTDWQATSHGHWSRDLAYVLGTGVPTDKRRLWERDMVKLYVTELAKAGGPTVSEEEAWLELRRQTFGALWYWTFTLTPSKIMPDMQSRETTLDFIGRITSLMDDHNALDSFNDL